MDCKPPTLVCVRVCCMSLARLRHAATAATTLLSQPGETEREDAILHVLRVLDDLRHDGSPASSVSAEQNTHDGEQPLQQKDYLACLEVYRRRARRASEARVADEERRRRLAPHARVRKEVVRGDCGRGRLGVLITQTVVVVCLPQRAGPDLSASSARNARFRHSRYAFRAQETGTFPAILTSPSFVSTAAAGNNVATSPLLSPTPPAGNTPSLTARGRAASGVAAQRIQSAHTRRQPGAVALTAGRERIEASERKLASRGGGASGMMSPTQQQVETALRLQRSMTPATNDLERPVAVLEEDLRQEYERVVDVTQVVSGVPQNPLHRWRSPPRPVYTVLKRRELPKEAPPAAPPAAASAAMSSPTVAVSKRPPPLIIADI